MRITGPAVIFLLLFIVAVSIRHFSVQDPDSISRTRLLMGTVVEITASGQVPGGLEAAVNAAFEEMARIEGLMSPHVAESDVDRLRKANSAIEVSPETAAIISLGLEVARASGGAFDMALGQLKMLWGVETAEPRVPSPEEIRQALVGTGLQGMTVQGRLVAKGHSETMIDLGGIAKGFAVDRALESMRRAGVEEASINAGGDIGLLGSRHGRPWRIGIQHPRDAQQAMAVLHLEDAVVVTSGDYQRYFEVEGQRYHHIFDPVTGYPADRSQSVTVVGGSAALADALSTAAFVLGPDAGLALLERFPGIDGLVVDAEGVPHWTSGLEGKVEWR